MKKILIIGANSYIGDSVRDYLIQTSHEYSVEIKDTIGWKPEVLDFVGFNAVFHVAGIAHRKETRENAHLYYEINRDFAINVAEKAKDAGVRQFIVMSTMSVYGMVTGHIEKNTKPNPKSHYGKSKLQADRVIWKMRDENFRVAVLRPPMVYGKGCKGNYQALRFFALKSPVFPDYQNQRSMLYIGNLCWFVKKVIDNNQQGLFFPQNTDYVNTSVMVKIIADSHGKMIFETRIFNSLLNAIPLNLIRKVFGNLTYEKVDTVDTFDFIHSVVMTEKAHEKIELKRQSSSYAGENRVSCDKEGIIKRPHMLN